MVVVYCNLQSDLC